MENYKYIHAILGAVLLDSLKDDQFPDLKNSQRVWDILRSYLENDFQ